MKNGRSDTWRTIEYGVGIFWLTSILLTLILSALLLWNLSAQWNFLGRVFSRSVGYAVGLPAVILLFSAAAKAWESLWEEEKAAIGSGWLAKTVAGLSLAIAAWVLIAELYDPAERFSEVVRCFIFATAALIASPSIEGERRRILAVIYTFGTIGSIVSRYLEWSLEGAQSWWVVILTAISTSMLTAGIQISIALGLYTWTRKRLEARRLPAPTGSSSESGLV